MKLFRSNFTDKMMVFGRQGGGDFPNTALVRKFSCTTEIEASLLNLIREDEYVHPESRDRLNLLRKQEAQAEIIDNIRIDEDCRTMHISYIYDEEKLRNLGTNERGALGRAVKSSDKMNKNPLVAISGDEYRSDQHKLGKWKLVEPGELETNGLQKHYTAYNFVVNTNSETTKIRIVTDSSCKTETGLSLNDVVKAPPGNIPSMRGILMRTRGAEVMMIFDIEKFFRTIYISPKDSNLRLLLLPKGGFAAHKPGEKWEFETVREMAIPFGDGPACDYSISCKDHIAKKNVSLVREGLREKVLKAVVEDCYVDDGNAMLEHDDDVKEYQEAITKVLGQGGFRIKGFETRDQGGDMKYLGVTWCRDDDTYKLKFRLNLGRVDRGERMDPDITEETLGTMTEISRRDLLGLTCQFYDPAGLGTPLIMGLRIIQSRVCNTMEAGSSSREPRQRGSGAR